MRQFVLRSFNRLRHSSLPVFNINHNYSFWHF